MTSDTVTDYELNDLIDARYMGLSCPQSSPQAHALVDSIIQIITKVEKRKRKRKKDTEADFRSAVGLMVSDLLIGVETKDAGWSYHQLSRSAFSDRPIGYKMFKSIITMMKTSGLLEVSLGRNAIGPQFDGSDKPAYYPSLASRFRPTAVMTSLVVAAGISDEGVRRHFQQQLPKTTIEVRAKKITLNGKKLNGKKLRFTHTDKSKAMEVEMKELNSFLSSLSLEGAGFSGYRRLFNNGDIDGFDFQWGGRVHAVATLRNLGGDNTGNGSGCSGADERASNARKWFHHLTFYGFMLCLASTSLATLYHYLLGREAPYGYLEAPVILGTVGGIILCIGTAGLWREKRRAAPATLSLATMGMDYAFIWLLFWVSATGLILLAVRETSFMGVALAVHLGLVYGFFLIMPFSKFVHGLYRFAALLADAGERQVSPKH